MVDTMLLWLGDEQSVVLQFSGKTKVDSPQYATYPRKFSQIQLNLRRQKKERKNKISATKKKINSRSQSCWRTFQFIDIALTRAESHSLLFYLMHVPKANILKSSLLIVTSMDTENLLRFLSQKYFAATQSE